ncbi:MAG TPA: EamA family transporter, partial [Anaerolineaceae bacterium]
MLELLIVSLLWAFSFGLIKDNLAGLNASFVAFARLGIAFLALSPFMRPNRLSRKQVLQFILIGAVQFGIMYIAYNASFRYLKAFEVALFTIFTPIYVALIDQFFERRVRWVSVAAAVLAVIGTGVISWAGLQSRNLATGFLVVQISNIAFALGQLAYRRVARDLPGDTKDIQLISLLYLGGAALTLGSTWISGGFNQVALAPRQVWILVYLGVIASGLGFYGWNRGA